MVNYDWRYKMSIAKRLKYSFKKYESIRFGTKQSVATEFDSAEMITLKELLHSFFKSQGILEYEILEDLFRTGGHADIHYRAIRFANQNGGAELVFAELTWGGDFVALEPWITLYGEWGKLQEQLKEVLTERYS